ncbi:MAG: hypothetical protein QOE70_6624 [Chthoniobacter sp.]|jgi:acyl-CoA thioesterase-1|nr:hypothetical protein [Chthoniobacter sp.]
MAAAQSPSSQSPDPSFLPPEDQPGLPRVLLIGDSISIGYTLPVRELLKGKANVHRIPVLATTTKHTLEQFDAWIGNARWDVIHFNWGLHDLRRMPDGNPQISLSDYEKNLRLLVDRLRPLGRRLIWCSTTPVPGTELDPPRFNDDVIAYNAIARRVMAENRIPVDDLYAFVVPQADRIRKPLNVHFTPKGCIVLAQQVARCISQVLASEADGTPERPDQSAR